MIQQPRCQTLTLTMVMQCSVIMHSDQLWLSAKHVQAGQHTMDRLSEGSIALQLAVHKPLGYQHKLQNLLQPPEIAKHKHRQCSHYLHSC